MSWWAFFFFSFCYPASVFVRHLLLSAAGPMSWLSGLKAARRGATDGRRGLRTPPGTKPQASAMKSMCWRKVVWLETHKFLKQEVYVSKSTAEPVYRNNMCNMHTPRGENFLYCLGHTIMVFLKMPFSSHHTKHLPSVIWKLVFPFHCNYLYTELITPGELEAAVLPQPVWLRVPTPSLAIHHPDANGLTPHRHHWRPPKKPASDKNQ